MILQDLIAKIGKGQKGARDLSREEAEWAMRHLLEGKASPYQVGAFLISLRVKEESPEELAAFVRVAESALDPAFRFHDLDLSDSLDLSFYAGKRNTFHVGLASSFIQAGAGAKVILHGDPDPPARMSKSAVLSRLGWDPRLPSGDRTAFFRENGWTYFDISQFHPVMKNFLDLRKEIGLRSVFHTVARFLNPLCASARMIGLSHPRSFEKIGDAAVRIGAKRALIFRGLEGESEAGLTGPLEAVQVDPAGFRRIRIDPASLGLNPVSRTATEIGDSDSEVQTLRRILDGTDQGDKRALALWNAALGLWIGTGGNSLESSFHRAARSLESGKALQIMSLLETSQITTGVKLR